MQIKIHFQRFQVESGKPVTNESWKPGILKRGIQATVHLWLVRLPGWSFNERTNGQIPTTCVCIQDPDGEAWASHSSRLASLIRSYHEIY